MTMQCNQLMQRDRQHDSMHVVPFGNIPIIIISSLRNYWIHRLLLSATPRRAHDDSPSLTPQQAHDVSGSLSVPNGHTIRQLTPHKGTRSW